MRQSPEFTIGNGMSIDDRLYMRLGRTGLVVSRVCLVHRGWAEEVIGRWICRRSRRDDVVLATKVGHPMSEAPNDCGLSVRNIVASCEASLRRLRTEWIDLYQTHHIDRALAWDEVWEGMEILVRHLVTRHPELEVIPAANAYGIGVLAWSPLHGGTAQRSAAQAFGRHSGQIRARARGSRAGRSP